MAKTGSHIRCYDPEVVKQLLELESPNSERLREIAAEVGALIISLEEYGELGGQLEYIKGET